MNGDTIKILLGQTASRLLRDAGSVFLVIDRASYPMDPQRMVLFAVPCDMVTATAACEVALGRMRATKPKTTKPATIRATLAAGEPEHLCRHD